MINPLMMKLASLFGDVSGPDGNFGSSSGIMPNVPQSPTFPNAVNVPNAGNDPQSGTDMSQVLADLFRPDRTQFDKLASMTPPNRADYKPSLSRKISAFMAGMGGNRPAGISSGSVLGFVNDPGEDIKNTKAVLDDPFNEAVEDYNRKLKPLETTAELENRRNVNDRMIGSQVLRDQEFQRKQDETERKNKEEERIRQFRAEAYDFKTRNPAFKSAIGDNGELVFYNPVDPTKVYYSGIQTGKLSDSDKINLETEGKLSEIQARAKSASDLEGQKQGNRKELEGTKLANAKELEGTKQINRLGLAETNIEGRKDVKAVVPGGSAARTQSETQKKQGLINKANQVISEHPELKPYIIIDKNGVTTNKPVVSITKSGIFGDEAKRMQAYNLIFGENPVVNKDVKSAQGVPAGKIRVKRNSDGVTGTIDSKDYDPKKYTKVQ